VIKTKGIPTRMGSWAENWVKTPSANETKRNGSWAQSEPTARAS